MKIGMTPAELIKRVSEEPANLPMSTPHPVGETYTESAIDDIVMSTCKVLGIEFPPKDDNAE